MGFVPYLGFYKLCKQSKVCKKGIAILRSHLVTLVMLSVESVV